MHEFQVASSQRKASRAAVRGLRPALWIALLLILPGGAQNGPPQPPHQQLPQSIGRGLGEQPEDLYGDYSIEQERQLRVLNADRQKAMIFDTNKLVKLANELDAEVSSTNPDSLTAAQLRKIAEIERLAHSVKEKMSTSVRGTPPYGPPVFPQHR
jgi:hypothetical protein